MDEKLKNSLCQKLSQAKAFEEENSLTISSIIEKCSSNEVKSLN
jgi:hypothetical protein